MMLLARGLLINHETFVEKELECLNDHFQSNISSSFIVAVEMRQMAVIVLVERIAI